MAVGLPLILGLAVFALLAFWAIKALSSPLARLPGHWWSIFSGVPHILKFVSGGHMKYVVGLSRRFGGIVRITPSEVLVSDPVAADLLLVKLDCPKPSWVYNMMRMPYLDEDSVLTFTNLDKQAGAHRKRRRLVFPAFAPSTLEKVETMIQTHIAELLERVARDSKQGLVDVCEVFDSLTLDVILDLAFDLHPHTLLASTEVNPKTAPENDPLSASKIRRAVSTALGFAGARSGLKLIGVDANRLNFIPYFREGSEALDSIKTFAEQVVAARRKASTEKGRNVKRDDLLQALVDSTDPDSGTRLSEREVVAETTLFLVAGNETTSAALTFAAGFLTLAGARCWKRLQEEVDLAFTEQQRLDPSITTKRQLSYAAVKDLKYLNAVILETLRLRPIAPFTPRYSPTDLTLSIDGTQHTIPANTMFSVSLAGISTNPKTWGSDADRFRPERFLDDSPYPDPSSIRHLLLAFSAGSRGCIGQNLARMQMKLALANMVLNFDNLGWSEPGLSEAKFDGWDGVWYMTTMKVKGRELRLDLVPR